MLSKEKLEHFRNLLLQKREEILSRINEQLDAGGEITKRTGYADEVDQASNELEYSLLYKLSERESKYLAKIEQKLREIEEGIYGICKSCGKEISIDRLEARPVADLCIECKIHQEEQENNNHFH